MSALSTSQTPSRCPCSHGGTLETPPGCGSASSVGEDARVSERLRVYENKDTVGKERWAVPRGMAVLGWLSPDLRPHPRLAGWQRGEEQRATAFASLLGQARSPVTCRVWLPWPRRG